MRGAEAAGLNSPNQGVLAVPRFDLEPAASVPRRVPVLSRYSHIHICKQDLVLEY